MDPNDYNYNQRYKRNIKVFVQIKPPIDPNSDTVKIAEDRKSLYVRCAQDFFRGNPKKEKKYWQFYTDGILYNIHPLEIYQIVTKEFLDRVFEGNNAMIIAYGQTGCGKSTTINGLQNSFENRGISLRLLDDLFKLRKEKRNEANVNVSISCIEVSKGYIIDLISDKENNKYCTPSQVTKTKIDSMSDGMNLIFKAEMKKTCSLDSFYSSHIYPSVITIHIENVSLIRSNPIIICSKVHIVDMAGTDTDGNSSCLHKTIPEIGYANLIKTQVEQLLILYNRHLMMDKVLLRGKGRLVEYLSDSIQPQCIIRFISHISSEQAFIHVTLSQLRFGHIAKCVAPAKLLPMVKTFTELQLQYLRDKLDYYVDQNYLDSMLMNKDLTNFLPTQRDEQVQKVVDEFINDKISDLELINVSDAQVTLKILKKTYDKEISELKSSLAEKDEMLEEFKANMAKGSLASKTSDQKDGMSSEKKKKRSLEKRLSHFSATVPKKSSRVGSIENYGRSLGKTTKKCSSTRVSQLRSKSGRSITPRSSMKMRSASTTTASKESEQDVNNLLLADIKNYEDLWNMFVIEESFDRLYTKLKSTFSEHRKFLKRYNDCIQKIENLNKTRNEKLEYLRKIRFFLENNDINCDPAQSNLDEKEQKIKDSIECLTFNLNHFKENLLSLQAELKISAGYIKEIKKDICNSFIKFCVENYGSSFGDGSYFVEELVSTEDKSVEIDPKELKTERESSAIEDTYYELQGELGRVIEAKKAGKTKNTRKTV